MKYFLKHGHYIEYSHGIFNRVVDGKRLLKSKSRKIFSNF